MYHPCILQVGEVMEARYEIVGFKGKGVFSTVVTARDRTRRDASGQPATVAIKMIRSNELMTKAAKTEVSILKLLAENDLEGHKHCVRLLATFEYRAHVCMVFEAFDLNLR